MSFWGSVKKYANYAPYAFGVPMKADALANKAMALGDESASTKAQRGQLEEQGAKAGAMADAGGQAYGALGSEAQAARDYFRRIAEGKDSLSAEQLRQGNQQVLAAQRSMAAGAAPANAVGAARLASINSMRASSGLAGQQAIAGIQERQAAQRALDESIARQRQLELQAALEGRRTAIAGYGGYKPEGSWLDKYGGAISGAAAVGAKVASDERLKEDVAELDDAEARKVLDGLKAYRFKYKDQQYGKGEQLGVMAQELEGAGLGHAVIDEPDGKKVHGAKLATSVAALAAALHRRVAKLEGKK